MTDDTIPVSEVGIGDDEVETTLENHSKELQSNWSVDDTEVNNDFLAGAAHIKVVIGEDVDRAPDDVQNYIIAEGLYLFDPHKCQDGRLSFRLTTREIYEIWSEMDTPSLGS